MRLVAGGAERVRKEPLRRAKPTARRETGEGEIEKPLTTGSWRYMNLNTRRTAYAFILGRLLSYESKAAVLL